MARQRIDLNGAWNFGVFDRTEVEKPPKGDRIIEVPRSYQSAFADLFSHTGYAAYTRSGFVVPEDWFANDVVLHFGAVNYWCELWVNGTLVGEHEGGYTPFAFRINEALYPDDGNEIALWVLTPAIDDERFPFTEIPHGKQDWYGPTGGIWQDVWIERRPVAHIESLRLTPHLAAGRVTAEVALAGLVDEEPCNDGATYELTATVTDRSGTDELLVIERCRVNVTDTTISFDLTIEKPRPWSPEDPHLYGARARLYHNGALVDEVADHFGMRSVAAVGGEFLLNGAPYYLAGALDQDFYPHTGYTPPSIGYLEDQFRKVKAMGLNLVRCHIKIPHPAYLEVADRLGVLVWYDLPNWGASFAESLRHRATEAAMQRGEALLEESVRIDHNHPSVVIRTIVNEDWGTDLVHNEPHRRWLETTWHRFKSLDPTRLLVDNSACCDNFHVKTDIEDFHIYFSMPDHRGAFDARLAEFAERPAWTFSGDAVRARRGDEVLVLSEFGTWGLPSLRQLEASYGEEPDWLHRRASAATTGRSGQSAEGAAVDPARAMDAFAESELSLVFHTFDDYAAASQRLQFDALRYQIQRIRGHETIRGYVVTELTDLHWEANGLLDMARKPKSHFPLWKGVNGQDLVLPRLERYTVFDDETLEVHLSVSRVSSRALEGGTIRWEALPGPRRGELRLGRCPRGRVTSIDTLRITFDATAEARLATVRCALIAGDDATVNETAVSVGVYPRPDYTSIGPVYCRHERLADYMSRHGATLVEEPENATVAIVDGVPTASEQRVGEAAGTLIVVLREPGEYTVGDRTVRVVRREGVLSGDWATNNNWISRTAFPNVLSDGLLGFEAEGIAGELVMERQPNTTVLAGLVVGWAYDGGAYCLVWEDASGGTVVAVTSPIERSAEKPALSAFLGDVLHLGATRWTRR